MDAATGGRPRQTGDAARLVAATRDLARLVHGELLPVSFRVTVLRPDDLVAFDVECVDLDRVTDDATGRTVLVPRPGGTSLLVVHFGPQHVGERAFYETRGSHDTGDPKPRQDEPKPPPGGGDEPLEPPPIEARFAEPSRLVFDVPADFGPIEYSTAGLLAAFEQLGLRIAWNAAAGTEEEPQSDWWLVEALSDALAAVLEQAPSTPAAARPDIVARAARVATALGGTLDRLQRVGRGFDPSLITVRPPWLRLPSEPGPQETAIEAPFRLVVSPNEHARWQHELEPVASADPGIRRVELWHTVLSDVRTGHAPTVRALWNRYRSAVDKKGTYPHDNTPFRTSLDDADRSMLVDLTANFALVNDRGDDFVPIPVEARRFVLSTLGAWLDVRGAWDVRPAGVSLEEWVHRAPMGRDQYVKVVYAGYLFPFGHKAALIKITERRIDRSLGTPIAYLFQHMYIAVRTPEVRYEGHLDMPFSSVRITTLVTPDLADPPTTTIDPALGARAFWPTLGDGTKFGFHCIATDAQGSMVDFDTPLVFIDEGLFSAIGARPNDVVTAAKKAFDAWSGDDGAPQHDPLVHGKPVALAATDRPGDTTFALASIAFTGGFQAAGDDPPFLPAMRRARAVVPSVQNLTGRPDPVPVRFHPGYVSSGFGNANPGQVFLERVAEQPPVGVDFGAAADRAGGFVRPEFGIDAISRIRGPVGGDAGAATSGVFDPHAFFAGGQGPLLFGVLALADIVSGVAPTFVHETLTTFQAFTQDAARVAGLVQQAAGAASAAGADVSALTGASGAFDAAVASVQQTLDEAASDPAKAATDFAAAAASATAALNGLRAVLAGLHLPSALLDDALARITVVDQLLSSGPLADALKTLHAGGALADALRRVRLEWSPRLTSFPNDPGMWIFGADAQTRLTLAVELRRNTGPDGKESPPGVDISCSLERFQVRLVPPMSMIVLHFDHIAFRSHDGKKPDVDVRFAPNGIEFVGILSFVETLKSLIPLDGFSDPPGIEVGSDGVMAGLSLGLPNLGIGIFSLENLSLGADFKVPFIGDPVSAGFTFCTRERPFTMTVSMLGGGGFFGLRVNPKGVMLLEAALEFGASLSVDLGVASGSVSIMAGIYFKMENDACSLTGYFRLRGEVEVLGLISASIELYLGLAFEFSSGKMAGRATLKVEVEVVCFSTTAEITCERKFAGAHGDPTLAELLDPGGTGGPGSPWFAYCEAFVGV